jgi:hypothetical protein
MKISARIMRPLELRENPIFRSTWLSFDGGRLSFGYMTNCGGVVIGEGLRPGSRQTVVLGLFSSHVTTGLDTALMRCEPVGYVFLLQSS